MTTADYHKVLLAILVWREGRGEPPAGKVGMAWTVRNRVLADPVGPDRWAAVISERLQFSGMTSPNDPNLILWPQDNDPSWLACMIAAEGVYDGITPDNTFGANLYANLTVCNPAWAHTARETVKLGATTFFIGEGVV